MTNSSSCHLSQIFDDEKEDLNTSTQKFIKRLDDIIKICFKKVRIKEKIDKNLDELFEKRNMLKNKTDMKSRDELLEVEKELAEVCAEINYNKIKEEIGNLKDEEGGVLLSIECAGLSGVWKTITCNSVSEAK